MASLQDAEYCLLACFQDSDYYHLASFENVDYSTDPDGLIECCHLLDQLADQVLCSERVSQMTKTYNDIEAVTNLLEEKERDLELAARIGQSLLEKNKVLEKRTSDYEEQLTEAQDQLKQLRHQLSQKEALLQVYMHEETSPETPEDERVQVSLGVVNFAGLQKKVKTLEDENLKLVCQSASLKTEMAIEEEKEESLFRDCVKHLEDYKNQVLHLQDEVIIKSDVALHQQEEITSLRIKTITLEGQLIKLKAELADMGKRFQAAKEAQQELTSEIGELKTRNDELEVLHREDQEEIRILRKKQKPGFIRHHASFNTPFLPEGSLALELEDSLRHDVECPPGYTPNDRRKHNSRVMKVARSVNKMARRSHAMSPTDSMTGNESGESFPGCSAIYMSEEEASEAGYGADTDSIYNEMNVGRPGIPGSNDLDRALQRLMPHDHLQSHDHEIQKENDQSDFGCMTPGGYSTGSCSNLSDFSKFSNISTTYKIPEKLQIVKPLEGSYTLHQWKRLATPHLGGVLEHRPGIQIKGESAVVEEEEQEVYSLSDYEEDDDLSLHLGKCMEQTSGIYTFTTARVMHPSDEYSAQTLTSPARPSSGTNMASTTTAVTSCVSFAKLGDHGTSTYSMSAGIAAGLHERGSQGQTSSSGSYGLPRYGNIVTETISGATQSQTELLYTTAGPVKGSIVNSSGINRENSYLQLADKVKDVGLNAILGIAKKSGIMPVELDPVDTGLNAILSIKRNKGAINRCTAEKVGQTIIYTRYARSRQPVKQEGPTVQTTQTLLTHSTRPLMSAPFPSRMGLPVRSRTSTPNKGSGFTRDDTDILKTLPSILATHSATSRPDSLAILSRNNTSPLALPFSEATPSCSVEGGSSLDFKAISSGEHTRKGSLEGMSAGLLGHLANLYSKTRGVLGASAALNSKNDKNS